MATSGVVTFRATRNQIIQAALRLIGATDPESPATSPTSQQISHGSEALNMMVKTWQTEGLRLWKKTYVAIFLRTGQQHYVLGNPGPAGDQACISFPLGTGFVTTTANSCSGTTLVVNSISSTATEGIPAITIASGWNIGIRASNGSFFWTTVNGAPAGNVITLATSFGANSLDSNPTVYAYETKSIRPLRVQAAFIRQAPPGATDIPVRIISQNEYNMFGNKNSLGTPVQLFFSPQENSGVVSVYPVRAINSGDILYMEVESPIEDFVTGVDDYDLPQEWGNVLKFQLAVEMAPEYGVSDSKFKQLVYLADKAFELVNNWDQELASVFLQPNVWDQNMGSRKGG